MSDVNVFCPNPQVGDVVRWSPWPEDSRIRVTAVSEKESTGTYTFTAERVSGTHRIQSRYYVWSSKVPDGLGHWRKYPHQSMGVDALVAKIAGLNAEISELQAKLSGTQQVKDDLMDCLRMALSSPKAGSAL